MPDAYTYISKPTDATYVPVNAVGREQYDQQSISYDDVSVFYDGYDENAYTNIAKPVDAGQTWNEINGIWNDATQTWNSSGTSPYTNITKPTT